MWDWSSFVSGLIGAMLGGGVTLYGLITDRKHKSREERLRIIRNIGEQAQGLLRLALVDEYIERNERRTNTATGIQNAALLSSITGLIPHVEKGEAAVVNWSRRAALEVIFADGPSGRVLAAVMIEQRLTQWHMDRLDVSWFERDQARLDTLRAEKHAEESTS